MSEVGEPIAKPDHAMVAVQAFSVNRGETFLLDAPQTGWRPGKDIAGTVVAAASDGTGPGIGTRVVGHSEQGGWAEKVAVATTSIAILPDAISFERAAALPLAGLTALRLLRSAGSVIGRRLLLTGASGGVGHYLTELAVASGAEVTAVCATPSRGARLRAFGATTVTDVDDAQGWFDLGLESVGGASFTSLRRKVRSDGQILWFGQAGLEPIRIDFFDWVDGGVGARITQFDYTKSDHTTADDLATLVRLVERKLLHPEIGSSSLWTSAADVIEDIRSRRVRGNAVLTVVA